jgi:hypothetical protein
MNTKYKMLLVAATVILMHSPASAADTKYLVISSVSSTEKISCDGPDEVISGGGRCWKDRNLGASQVATSPGDAAALGDYYQWGRPRDGHQHSTSGVTTTRSGYDDPVNTDFILESGGSSDWRSPGNDILWQGLSGINNPCPQSFRLPTELEWKTEMASWDSQDVVGAFSSPLKLVLAGQRSSLDGSIDFKSARGYYWSSATDGVYSRNVRIDLDDTSINTAYRMVGMSVRCIKD